MLARKVFMIATITIVCVPAVRSLQAGLVEPDVMATAIAQTPYLVRQLVPFSVGLFPDELSISMKRVITPLGKEDEAGSAAVFPSMTSTRRDTGLLGGVLNGLGASGRQGRLESDFRSNWNGSWDSFCAAGSSHLAIRSSLNHNYVPGEELARLYELDFSAYSLCYLDDFWYSYDVFSANNGAAYRSVATGNPSGDISAVSIPEPSTIVLIGLGALIFVVKGR